MSAVLRDFGDLRSANRNQVAIGDAMASVRLVVAAFLEMDTDRNPLTQATMPFAFGRHGQPTQRTNAPAYPVLFLHRELRREQLRAEACGVGGFAFEA